MPEAEVWLRLRAPTLGEMIARGLEHSHEFSPGVELTCEWIVGRDAEATWGDSPADIRRSGEQLVAMVAPVLDDPEEAGRRVRAWAEEWGLLDE